MDELDPQEEAERLLLMARRVEALAAGAPMAVLSALSSILILLATFIQSSFAFVTIAWAIAGFAVVLARYLVVSGIDRTSQNYTHLWRGFRRARASMIAMSLLWGAGFAFFAAIADGLQLAALAVVATAIYVGVLMMHRPTPRAAYVHVVAVGGGMAAAAWIAGGTQAWFIIPLIGVYGATMWRAIGKQETMFRESIAKEAALRESSETVRLLLNDYEAHSSDWLWTVGPRGNLRDVPQRLARAAGRAPQELEGIALVELFEPGEERDELASLLEQRKGFRDLTLKIRIGEENRFWQLTAHPREDGRMSGVSRDVTLDKQSEERVAFMAHFDSLTGLANRYLFNERLREMLARDGQTAANACLFYLDLDDFKAINDTRGHMIGDRLLREVASRLEQEVRPQDLVARLGGDEFAILIETKAGAGMLIERAHRFLSVVREPYEIEGQLYRVSTSVGVARCLEGDCDAEELMRRADLALYAAKEKGRDNLALFETQMDLAARERRQTEIDLREAVGRDDLRLHYQPVIDLDSGRTTGYEALLRWYHPDKGIIAPSDFIKVAEQSGLIVPIGEWVIQQALAEIAKWNGDFRIAINLSPTQVNSPHLLSLVAQAIHANAIAPDRIEFEITENVLLEETGVSHATLLKLRELGTRIALDDFGTGYSSLSYLRQFPFDRIKIDRNFVKDIEHNRDNQAIVSSITRLADALGMSTTAEGIENREQLDLLRKLGCNEAQGYLICEPVPADKLPAGEGAITEVQDVGADILDYRRAREAALKRKANRVA